MTQSAGLLMFRRLREGGFEVLLGHPGGPYWARRDAGAWTLPKGEIEPPEEPIAAACREFEEETGLAPTPPFTPLGEVRQRSGKRIHAWAFEGSFDPAALRSNTFEIEWPPRSGRREVFPEIDRVAWFGIDEARTRMNPAQCALLDRLAASV